MPYLGQSPSKGDENNFKILDDISSYTLTFDGSDSSVVSAANDTITSLTHRFVQGQRVTYNNGGGSNIAGLTSGTVYYVIKHDHHNIKLATSASNATNGIAVNITNVGGGASHTINVAFDGVNTKFKATHTSGQKARITRSAQLVISMNGVIQQPHDTATPSTGFGFDLDGTIVFSQAPVSSDVFWAHVLTNNNVTFDISDNDIDNFTGDGSTVSFNLSKSPPDNRNILVTVDGVVQYPNDPDGTERSYTVVENVLTFSTAPALGTEVQVRHIGFAGSTSGGGSGGVTSFYGRTGAVVLKSTDNIVANNATFSGDLTVNGTTTTLDTQLVEVDKIEVETTSTNVAVAVTHNGSGDLIRLHDGASQVVTIDDEGKIGINSTSPREKLDVIGNANIIVDNNNGIKLGYRGENKTAYIGLDANDNANAGSQSWANSAWIGFYSDGSSERSITYRTNVGSHIFQGTNGGEFARISSDGKVGINTTDTGHLITVLAQTASSTIARFKAVNKNSNFDIHTDVSSHGQAYVRNNIGAAKVALNSNGASYFTGGSVGIGTENPATELEVQGTSGGTIRLAKGVAAANREISAGDTLGKIQFRSYDGSLNYNSYNATYVEIETVAVDTLGGPPGNNVRLDFKIADSDEPDSGKAITPVPALSILQGGNVGIGITNPTGLLHAQNASATDTKIIIESTGTNSYPAFRVKNDARDYDLGIDGSDDSFRVYDVTATAERFTITTDGSIRIDGPTAATHGLRFTPNGWNGYDNRMGYCGSSGADFWWSSNWDPTTANRDHNGYATNYIRENIQTGYISFGTGAIDVSAVERLRITSGGQISISGAGTTFGNNTLLNIAPANRTTTFDASDGDTWHDLVLKQSAAATTNSVGIAFEISPSAYHKNAGTGIVAIKDGNNFDYGTHLAFITRPHTAVAEERVRITSAGDVGIGTDSPSYRLQVHHGNPGGLLRLLSGHEGNYDLRFVYQNSEANIWSYGSKDLTFGTRYAKKLHLVTNGPGKRLTINDGGYVGINSTAPAGAQLVIKNSDDSNLNAISIFNDNGNMSSSLSQDSSGAGSYLQKDNAGNIKTFIRSYNTSYFLGGNIGIGTNSPVTNLDVRGSSDASITIGLNNGTKYGNFSCDNSATYLYAYNGNDIIFSTHSGNSFNRKVTILNSGQVLVGTTTSLSFNGVGQNHNLIVAGSSNDQDITDNYNAAITISNQDNTANNTAGLHFAREDSDGTPHYDGASIVAQFKDSMNTGQYPRADLAFLTSTANNNAPSEKMRLSAGGNVKAILGAFDSRWGDTLDVTIDTASWAADTFYRVVNDNVFDSSNDTYLVWFKWSHDGSGAPWLITGNFLWTPTGANTTGAVSPVITPVQTAHNSASTISFRGEAGGNVRPGLSARADGWNPSGGDLYIKASKIGHPFA